MNLPNKLTITRLVLVPVFFIFFLLGKYTSLTVLSTAMMLIIYAVAELTDLLDGKIARGRGMITDLGKVMDPFADTLTHMTYFVCFLFSSIMPLWAFVLIMWREFSILFVRMILAKYAGKAMSANIFGKAKTVLYAFTTLLSFIYLAISSFSSGNLSWLGTYKTVLYVFFSLSAFASVASFIIYIREVFKSGVLAGMTR